jgi:hypothetical protein
MFRVTYRQLPDRMNEEKIKYGISDGASETQVNADIHRLLKLERPVIVFNFRFLLMWFLLKSK